MHPSSWNVGDIAVHRVDEIPLPPATGAWLLPDATPDVVAASDWLLPHHATTTGALRLDSHSFAFEAGGLRVLVDTGIGNGKPRATPAWHDLRTDYPDRLAAAGFPPGSVDLVVLTHLHTDHVGWNTRRAAGEWVPTFTNAHHVTSRVERDFWASHPLDEARARVFRDSVAPVERAGLLEPVDVPEGGLEVAPGVRLLPTPGHTPGHVAVELAGGRALITGDCLHHPVQLARPDLTACVDVDPARARATRRALLERLAGTGALLLGTHFAAPTAGHVVRHGSEYRLVHPSAGQEK